MMIRSATALRNDYDGMVKLSIEKQSRFSSRATEMAKWSFLPIELWEKRQAELELFAEMLRRRTDLPAQGLILLRICRRKRRSCFVRVEWLSEARNEYRQLLQYYKTEVGLPYARKFLLTSVKAEVFL